MKYVVWACHHEVWLFGCISSEELYVAKSDVKFIIGVTSLLKSSHINIWCHLNNVFSGPRIHFHSNEVFGQTIFSFMMWIRGISVLGTK